ncbi:MAG: hypothetical protein F4219_05025 [Gammaproteobacteria bacterium]|nr:hypothetical protein [Gammaproteobacteria bacterium]
MADAAERHGFTREQIEFLRETLGRPSAQGFDRPTLKWLIGGTVAAGLAMSGILWAEIGSVREELRAEIGSVRAEIGSVRTELRAEIRENRVAISANRDAIAELAKGQARIEAILEERLPRAR